MNKDKIREALEYGADYFQKFPNRITDLYGDALAELDKPDNLEAVTKERDKFERAVNYASGTLRSFDLCVKWESTVFCKDMTKLSDCDACWKQYLLKAVED